MQQPNKQLVNDVKAGFIKQGSSLHAYCKTNKIDNSNAYKALRGKWNGELGKNLRAQVIAAAQIAPTPQTN